MIGPPNINFTAAGTYDGDAACDGCSDAEPPIGVLIEAQHLPAEGHPQRHQQEKDPDDPGELSRKFVGPEQEDLHHVNEDDRDHEVRPPPVQCADEPAESHVVVEGLQAAPGFRGRWNIDEGEQNSGDDLQHEDGERGAAEHIKPARGIPWDRMLHGFANRRRQLQAPVEPFPDLGNHAWHGGFFPTRAALGDPGVGSSPASIVIRPFCTLYGYSNNPRSGGPEAREPSR